MAAPSACSGVIDFAEQRRAEHGREQRLEVHDQGGAERPDAHRRHVKRQRRDGDASAQHDQEDPAVGRVRRMPVHGDDRRGGKNRRRGDERMPRRHARIGVLQLGAGDQQERGAAERGADCKAYPGGRQMLRIGAHHQRQPEERHDGRERAAPSERVYAECRATDPRQQRIDEIGQHRDRHGDQIDRLEQPVDDARRTARRARARRLVRAASPAPAACRRADRRT